MAGEKVAAGLQAATFTLADMLAGDAVFTMVSHATGASFTYRVSTVKFDDGKIMTFVKVLTGEDNEADYTYAGVLPCTYAVKHAATDGKKAPVEVITATLQAGTVAVKTTKASKIEADAPSMVAFNWLVSNLARGKHVTQAADILLSGHCLKCHRRLTVASSIENKYGPKCYEALWG